MSDPTKNPPMNHSLQTGIQIIELMAQQEQPLKFSEIQELSGLTKSNLYKYLNTLTYYGWLYRDKKRGTYSLGSKLIEYGNAAIGSQNIIEKVTPYLQEISRHTSLTALLSVWTYEGPVIANISTSNPGINIGAQIGTRLPLLSATGKIFAAFKHGPDVQEWKQKELQKLSEHKRKEWEKEQQAIREEQFVYAREPLVEHVSSFSVPLLNYKKEFIGALTVVGFSHLIPHYLEDPISQYVRQCSLEISRSFGYQPAKKKSSDIEHSSKP